jgi:hypothetical protein
MNRAVQFLVNHKAQIDAKPHRHSSCLLSIVCPPFLPYPFAQSIKHPPSVRIAPPP